MNPPATCHRFPLTTALTSLTVAVVGMMALAWLAIPATFGQVERMTLLMAASFGVVWITGVVGMAIVAILGPLGPMATISGYFGGMALRMAMTMGAALLLFHRDLVDGSPLAAALAIAYVPALAIEVAFVARYLWQMDSQARGMPRQAKEALA